MLHGKLKVRYNAVGKGVTVVGSTEGYNQNIIEKDIIEKGRLEI